MNKNNTVILLTACINPKGMHSTKLQNVDVRMKQYKKALLYYLENTEFKIVLVENTLTDFQFDFEEYIHSGRLEYLTFAGNDYDKSLGKGYGEALIIEYALNNSLFIATAKYIIKITGRLIIENINQLCSVANLAKKRQAQVACNIRPSKKFGTSTFIIFEKSFLLQYFIPNLGRIDEKKGKWFEHILYDSIQKCKDDGGKCLIFSKPIKILGLAGTTSMPYPKVKWIDYILSWGAALLYNRLGYENF